MQGNKGSEVKPGKPNHSPTAPEAGPATTELKPLLKAQAGALNGAPGPTAGGRGLPGEAAQGN